jgi:hypothetical protein
MLGYCYTLLKKVCKYRHTCIYAFCIHIKKNYCPAPFSKERVSRDFRKCRGTVSLIILYGAGRLAKSEVRKSHDTVSLINNRVGTPTDGF